jgi:dTDP-4-dehydrorhamnose 3,5-epimerase
MDQLSNILVTNLKVIQTPKGCVKKNIQEDSSSYFGFGESYFSEVFIHDIKGWKRHKEMILNLTVVFGDVKFVFYDDRDKDNPIITEYTIGDSNYCRITVPTNIWFSFKGLNSPKSIIHNFSSIVHDDNEVEVIPLDSQNRIPYEW